MSTLNELTSEELTRYGRHIILPEVGVDGQRRLKQARVLVVGAGGLGSPLALYLAAAGVGTLGLADPDVVGLSNLQRQILHGTAGVGLSKLVSARSRLLAINPHLRLELHHVALTSANALSLVGAYDVVADGTDNFPARYLVNDACILKGKPNIHGAVFRFEGQASVFGPDGPCYRCVFPEPPPPGLVPSCAEAGVFGVLPGVIGTIQATEVIKWILGIGTSLKGRLLTYDALQMRFLELAIRRDPQCPMCGDTPSIQALVDYEAFCGGGPSAAPVPGRPDVPGAATPVAPELPFHVRPLELKARWDRGDRPLLLDVREPHEFETVHLEGAVLIPLGELTARVGELDPAAEVVVYCHIGVRSMRAVSYLRHAGLTRAQNLAGGIDAWSLEVDPAVRRY
jgi:adenylyltransferase/sulfurtransferase